MKYKYKIPHNFLKKRLEKIGKYNTAAEKQILLEEDLSHKEIFKILFPDSELQPVSEIEAACFVLKGIENSLNDVIEGYQECSCGTINDFMYEIEELINTDIETDIPIGLFDSLDEIIDSDNIVLKTCNDLQNEIIENNKKILQLNKTITCRNPACKKTIPFVIDPKVFVSKTSVSNIFDQYFNLMFHLHITKKDIDELPPFEREIYLGLLKKKLESNPLPNLPFG